jgi:hypothetical protein
MSETAAFEATRTALEISRDFELGAEACTLLVERMQPEPFLDALQAGKHLVDACRFLAHALPKRNAVMWACACLRQVLDPAAIDADAGLRAAECWVEDPSETNRRSALGAGETAKAGDPGGLAALAAGLSGGSLAPLDAPPVPPGDLETARAVIGIVLLAAVRSQPEKASEKFARFVELGREISLRPLPPLPAAQAEPIQSSCTPTRPEVFNDTASIARGWSETEAAEPENVPSAAKSAPPPPLARRAARPTLLPRSSKPLSRTPGEATPKLPEAKPNPPEAKPHPPEPTFDESIGKMSFDEE